ncbi:hypothetical protein [Salinicoccus hispanicus]|nr:hypothetical protein [Salinicoccus hispanicus]
MTEIPVILVTELYDDFNEQSHEIQDIYIPDTINYFSHQCCF